MDLTLTPDQLELRDRARAFVTRRPPAARGRVRAQPRHAPARDHPRDQAARHRAASLHGGSLPRARRRPGLVAPWSRSSSTSSWARSTGGLWGYIPGGYNALVHCSRRAARSATWTPASAASATAATRSPSRGRARTPGRWPRPPSATRPPASTSSTARSGSSPGPPDTDFMIFHCHLLRDGERLPTLFLVDYDAPGVAQIHDPDYTHTFADRHPQFVPDRRPRATPTRSWAAIGEADVMTNEWFVEERLHIGARCTGAMERLLTLAVDWATRPGPVRRADLRLPGRELPAGGLRRGRLGRAPADPRGGLDDGPGRATRRSSTPARRSPSCSRPRPRSAAPTASSRSSAGAATCASSRPSGTCASCAWTASGRAPRRSSGWSSRGRWRSAAWTPSSADRSAQRPRTRPMSEPAPSPRRHRPPPAVRAAVHRGRRGEPARLAGHDRARQPRG